MSRSLFAVVFYCVGASLFAITSASEKKDFKHTPDETRVFDLANEERKKKDLRAFTLNPALSKVARAHSENMARQGKFAHTLDGKEPADRLTEAKYNYMKMAENIGMGDEGASVEVIMKAWMESEGHRANILFAEYTEIGVGIARAKDGQAYYTQIFARPFKK